MPVDIYALLKAKGETIEGIECETPDRNPQTLPGGIECTFDTSPHFHFVVRNQMTNKDVEVKVNVRSHASRRSSRDRLNLLCYINEDFKHPINEKLKKLEYGYHQFDYDWVSRQKNRNSTRLCSNGVI